MAAPETMKPLRIINASAPIRICDTGGWTDTWFAGHGAVFNIAVRPGVDVQVVVLPRTAGRARVVVDAEHAGLPFVIDPDRPGPGRHPLIEAAIAECPPPDEVAIEVEVYSDVPPGCSAGTSAAMTVALVAALDRCRGGCWTPAELARAAHRIEVERLGLQSGIQDQCAAAHGGISFIDIPSYPDATLTRLDPGRDLLWELERRLLLVYLGQAHRSSEMHEHVIARLASEGTAAPQLEALRQTARRSRDAVLACDLEALGEAMIASTQAQAALHPELVGAAAREVIGLARDHGASGWKVNGAGGAGGSLTVLCGPLARQRRALERAIARANPQYRVLPVLLSADGVRVWERQEG